AVARVVTTVRINLRSECQKVAIGRPQHIVRTGREASDLDGLSGACGDDVDLLRAGARGEKRKEAAVGRPLRPRVAAAARELTRLTTSRRHQPDVADGPIHFLVGRGDFVGDQSAVARDLRLAYAVKLDEVIKGDRMLCRSLSGCLAAGRWPCQGQCQHAANQGRWLYPKHISSRCLGKHCMMAFSAAVSKRLGQGSK